MNNPVSSHNIVSADSHRLKADTDRPLRRTAESSPETLPSDRFTASNKSAPEPYDYTVVSLLGANFDSRDGREVLGATRELKEYLEILAPAIKDRSLALVVLGRFKESDNSWGVKRYVITSEGVKDTSDGIKGARSPARDILHLSIEELLSPSSIDDSRPATGGNVSVINRETLKNHIIYAMECCPARNYVLNTMTHGNSILGISERVDEGGRTDRRERLTLGELKQTLREARETTGKKFGVIDLDGCLLGQAEVVSALEDEVDYIVASPNVESVVNAEDCPDGVPRSGHQQVEVFEKILKHPSITPQELAQEFVIVTRRKEEAVEARSGEGISDEFEEAEREAVKHAVSTLSAYSTREMSVLNRSLNRIGIELLEQWKKPGFKDQFMKDMRECKYYHQTQYVDLQDFLNRMKPHLEKGTYLRAMRALGRISLADYRQGDTASDSKTSQSQNSDDYSGHGPVAILIPGLSDNMLYDGDELESLFEPFLCPVEEAFTSNLLGTDEQKKREVLKSLKRDFSVARKAWDLADARADEIGLTGAEKLECRKVLSLIDTISGGNAGSVDEIPDSGLDEKFDAAKRSYRELLLVKDNYDRDPDYSHFKVAGMKKILAYCARKFPGNREFYEKLQALPQKWKDFVLKVSHHAFKKRLEIPAAKDIIVSFSPPTPRKSEEK